ncbi:MAG: hypothetical protein SAL07_24935 [Oscillatoria sp. PMC 1051.18]|nr:hypothetical protein [Oscillatoria sp. PMC 1050.18]MEC5033154.1 hypothetical protein [Oscillatoria sp. PMC 1051.18]
MNHNQLLIEAANSVTKRQRNKPDPNNVVEALLQAEKAAKKERHSSNYEQLIGTWKLCFITGTKKTRQRAGIVLGSGRYLPSWLTIKLSYSQLNESQAQDKFTAGKVENTVQFSGLEFSLQGPVKFLSPKNILAFDFTQMKVKLFGITFYDGYIRGGKEAEAIFLQEKIAKQAFFAYFITSDRLIAARGRGGGLALWGKI